MRDDSTSPRLRTARTRGSHPALLATPSFRKISKFAAARLPPTTPSGLSPQLTLGDGVM